MTWDEDAFIRSLKDSGLHRYFLHHFITNSSVLKSILKVNAFISKGGLHHIPDLSATQNTLLMILLKMKNISAAVKLLEHPAINVNIPDSYGMTPLMYASYCGYAEFVNQLLARKEININRKSKYTYHSALTFSVQHPEILLKLLEIPGLDLTAKHGQGPRAIRMLEARFYGENMPSETMVVLNKLKEKVALQNPRSVWPDRESYIRHNMLIYRTIERSMKCGTEDECEPIEETLIQLARNPETDLFFKVPKPHSWDDCYESLYEAARHQGFGRWALTSIRENALRACDIHIRTGTILKIEDPLFLNRRNEDGETLLHVAVSCQNIPAVEYLLTRPGIDVNRAKYLVEDMDEGRWGSYRTNPLYIACERGFLSIVECLLTHPDIDVNRKSGYTPLIAAILADQRAVVECLLQHPDIQISSKTVQYAIERPEMYQVLVASGRMRAANYRAAFLYASSRNELRDMDAHLSRLAETAKGVDLRRALFKACFYAADGGLTEMVEWLVARGAPLNRAVKDKVPREYMTDMTEHRTRFSQNQTMLMAAAQNGHRDGVAYLVAIEKCDVVHKNHNGDNALMLAARGGHTLTVSLLLDNERIPKLEVNKEGDTAFTLAVKSGNSTTVSLFMDRPVEERANKDSMFEIASRREDAAMLFLLSSMPEVSDPHRYRKEAFAIAAKKHDVATITSLLHEEFVDDEIVQSVFKRVTCSNGCDRVSQREAAHVQLTEMMYRTGRITPTLLNDAFLAANILTHHLHHWESRERTRRLWNFLFSCPELDVNWVGKDGDTPLIILSENNEWLDLFGKLLNHPDIDVNHVNNLGERKLKFVIEERAYTLLEILLARDDIDLLCDTRRKETALHKFCTHYKFIGPLHTFMDRLTPFVNDKNYRGYTPLMLACANGFPDIVNRLLEEPVTRIESYDVLNTMTHDIRCSQILHRHRQRKNEIMGLCEVNCFGQSRRGVKLPYIPMDALRMIRNYILEMPSEHDRMDSATGKWRTSSNSPGKPTTPPFVLNRNPSDELLEWLSELKTIRPEQDWVDMEELELLREMGGDEQHPVPDWIDTEELEILKHMGANEYHPIEEWINEEEEEWRIELKEKRPFVDWVEPQYQSEPLLEEVIEAPPIPKRVSQNTVQWITNHIQKVDTLHRNV